MYAKCLAMRPVAAAGEVLLAPKAINTLGQNSHGYWLGNSPSGIVADFSGRSAAWLAHQTGGLGVAGSNPVAPIEKTDGSGNRRGHQRLSGH